MKEIHTEIEINAPAEKIWKVLTDFAAYPEWNPFVRRGEGRGQGWCSPSHLHPAFWGQGDVIPPHRAGGRSQPGNSAGWVISGCVDCLTASIRSRSSR